MASKSTHESLQDVDTPLIGESHRSDLQRHESRLTVVEDAHVSNLPEESPQADYLSFEMVTVNGLVSNHSRDNQTSENVEDSRISTITNWTQEGNNEHVIPGSENDFVSGWETDDGLSIPDDDDSVTGSDTSDEDSDTDDGLESGDEDWDYLHPNEDEDSEYTDDEEFEPTEDDSQNHEETLEFGERNENVSAPEAHVLASRSKPLNSNGVCKIPFNLTSVYLRSILLLNEEGIEHFRSLESSILQSENGNEKLLQEKPDIDMIFPEHYFELHNSEMDNITQFRVFGELVTITSGALQQAPNFPFNRYGIESALLAQWVVLKCLTKQLIKNKYCENFGNLRNKLEENIRLLYQSCPVDDASPSSANQGFSKRMSDLFNNLEKLRDWDAEESFYCGKSAKFDGITSFNDFLPQTDDPNYCAICMTTALETSSDFGILSECSHVILQRMLDQMVQRKTGWCEADVQSSLNSRTHECTLDNHSNGDNE
ncbi:hypothetical protein FHG87_011224 [Trinorchestia longiramus]|nr:hypothetical protein FHG87_011224 [Trinorchestia longiramus]